MRALTATVLALALGSCFTLDRLTRDDSPAELTSGDEVKVTAVVKGDEVKVKKAGKTAKVRLLGLHAFSDVIDDPDLRQMHQQSIAYLRETVVGQRVTVIFGEPKKDAHDRYLAYVSAKGVDINRAMLDAGSVTVYTEYAFDREPGYLQAEAAARLARRGIWANDASLKLIVALRKEWRERRRGGPEPPDPLLAPAGEQE